MIRSAAVYGGHYELCQAHCAKIVLVGLLRPHFAKEKEARALIRELLASSADIVPNNAENILSIHVHRLACPVHDKAIGVLFDRLNQANFHHPETNARLIWGLSRKRENWKTRYRFLRLMSRICEKY